MKNTFKLLWPLYLSEFFAGFSFFAPIWILFFQARGLTLADIGLISSVAYFGSVLLEYPSGILADKYGRKSCLLFSSFLQTTAIFLEVNAYSKLQFLIAAFLTGMSFAFASGARQALIYDKLKENKLEKSNSKVTGLIDAITYTGVFISALTGSVIYTYNATYPYWLAILFNVIALSFLFFLKETKCAQKDQKTELFKQFKTGFKLIFKKPIILSLLLLYFSLFLFDDAWHGSNQKFLVDMGLPIAYLGVNSI